MILFDAIYLNSLGGKKLLKLMLSNLYERKQWNFILDSRLKFEYTLSKSIKFKKASILSRFFFYLMKFRCYESIFCFSNIPPPFKINRRVFIFFHNDNLIEPSIVNTSFRDKLILKLKFLYIKSFSFENYKWIVQTNYMKNRLTHFFKISHENIFVIPIFDDSNLKFQQLRKRNEFLYVSDFQAHKNHDKLIKAFLLYSNKSTSSINLHLTIPNNKYDSFIKKYIIPKNLKIINHGVCNEPQINDLYTRCKYFIFPSTQESFGLPLIEACQNDCKVIAPNLEYVHEIIKPSLLFDPLSVNSIASSIDLAINSRSLKKSRVIIKNKLNLLIKLVEQNV